jgi:hypothetical protein
MTATSTTAASGAVFGFTDPGGTSAAFGSVEVFNSSFAEFTAGKGYKSEATGSACVTIEWHVEIDDGLVVGKEFA